MIDHLKGFFDASDKLKSTGATLDDDLLAIMLLHSLPSSFENFRCAIESRDKLPDLEILKIKILEEHKSRHSVNDNHNSSAMLAKNKQGYSRAGGGSTSRPASNNAASHKPKPSYKCGFCKKKGHKEADCYKKKRSQEEAKDETSGLCFFTSTTTSAKWCLDSGSTSHVCGDKSVLKNITRHNGSLQLASNTTAAIRAKGDVNIVPGDDSTIVTLKDTLLVPDLRTNLMSVAKVVDAGFDVKFSKKLATITAETGEVIARAERIGDLFFIDGTERPRPISAMAKINVDMSEWHARLGHLNSNDLKTMIQKQHAEGMGNVKVEDIGCCSTCAIAKMTREPFESRVRYAAKPLEVIHTDVCSPMRTISKGGARWFATFIDEHTRFCHVYLMKEKSQVTEKFVEFKNMVEKQTGYSIKELQSDGGGEYDNRKLDNLCKDAGIKRRFTVPHTPQQNCLAERKNRTLVETARCLLTQSGLPKSFWAEAIMTANYTRNRCYTNTIGCTPYEKWTGRKPDVSHMRPFGEKIYALDKTPTKGKFDCRGLEGYFLGYADNSKAYRVWLVNARKIICSRDVKFSNKFDSSLIEENPAASHDLNIVDLSTQTAPAPDLNPIAAAEPDDDHQSKTNVEPNDEAPPHDSPSLQNEPKQAQQDQEGTDVSTKNELFNRAVPTENPDAVKPYEGHVTRSRTRLNRLAASESAMSACEVDIKDALSGPNKAAWFEAMCEEIKSLINNDTWTIVEKPRNVRLVGCRTVLRNKFNPDGTICRRKARLVAQGFSQIPGTDFFETFAPVARLDSLRTLTAIAARHKLKLFQCDVVTAYLHGELDTELHMQTPKMLSEILESIVATDENELTVNKAKKMLNDLKGSDHSACKLNKALYGLRQAGRKWHEKINGVLQDLGLRPTNSDPCLYTDSHDKLTFVLLYVDDILFVSRNAARVAEIKKGLAESFDLKDMGPAKYCLGLEIDQSD
ncbi:unnamed protein product [Trichogramma brassicae]|uniref:Integrase catalytic domain-containing protein n=1 Tax=Trichogramma brassicae TaxID=86971 RepID=A0A6H5IZ89_9HYME|nr:unnamed protein product [Trichogramma brassicae]